MNDIIQIMTKFNQFKESLHGKDINKMYQEIVNSGKYSKEQIEQAKQMAEQFKIFLNL